MSPPPLAELWQEAHEKSGPFTAFKDALDGLTPQQAAWKPDPRRHSIWQIVSHIAFWREYMLARLHGENPRDDEIGRRNWEEPQTISPEAWQEALARFERTRDAMHQALREGKGSELHLGGHLLHDVYHLGQIMYVRALQGLPPVS